jgi:hypothetical protein
MGKKRTRPPIRPRINEWLASYSRTLALARSAGVRDPFVDGDPAEL